MNNELTIIVPVFNEEESLASFFTEMDAFVNSAPISSQVLLVNDGSTDGSEAILKKKCHNSIYYRYVTLDRNYGLSTAIKAGIDECKTSLIGYIDADLQTKPEDFLLYLDYFPRYDMVNGIRLKRKDTVIKRLSSKFANAYRRLMINDGIEDSCCPLKIFKTSYAREMPFFTGMHRFIPALIKLQNGTVKQIPISHYSRYAGTSKYHLWNRLIGPFFDTFAFRWMQSRYINYKIADKNR
jgi:dolichol-phosphate mannosyltransferase